MPPKFDPSLLPASPDLCLEIALWQAGVEVIAGIDEAGRGALAGPVAAAALILPSEPEVAGLLAGVRDSKQMTPDQRERWAQRLQTLALDWGLGFATSEEIDALRIVPATRLAAQRALSALRSAPDHLLIDYLLLPDSPIPQTALTKGDARSLSIAGASILAKVARDRQMCDLDRSYPHYGFARHKGYGTHQHRQAIAQRGPTPVHRLGFTWKQ